MRATDFWDDQEQASRVSAEYSRAKRRLEDFGALEARFADLESTEELLREELSGDAIDDELLQELVSGVASLEADLQRGEELRFFSGKYDEGGAILTIHRRRRRHRVAGLGRDAAAHVPALVRAAGFKVEMHRSARRRRGGHQERHAHRRGRLTPTATCKRSAECTVSCASRPSTPPTAATPLRLRRRSAASRRRRRDRDQRGRPAHRHLPLSGRRRPARQQDRARPCASRTCRPASWCSARTSAPSSRTRPWPCTMLKSKLVELEERKRAEEHARERGEDDEIGFGSQIRSYVLHPYQMVKDTAPATRRATCRPCSTAIWTGSCTRTWSGARAAARSASSGRGGPAIAGGTPRPASSGVARRSACAAHDPRRA